MFDIDTACGRAADSLLDHHLSRIEREAEASRTAHVLLEGAVFDALMQADPERVVWAPALAEWQASVVELVHEMHYDDGDTTLRDLLQIAAHAALGGSQLAVELIGRIAAKHADRHADDGACELIDGGRP